MRYLVCVRAAPCDTYALATEPLTVLVFISTSALGRVVMVLHPAMLIIIENWVFMGGQYRVGLYRSWLQLLSQLRQMGACRELVSPMLV